MDASRGVGERFRSLAVVSGIGDDAPESIEAFPAPVAVRVEKRQGEAQREGGWHRPLLRGP